jgi:hypothetical protein
VREDKRQGEYLAGFRLTKEELEAQERKKWAEAAKAYGCVLPRGRLTKETSDALSSLAMIHAEELMEAAMAPPPASHLYSSDDSVDSGESDGEVKDKDSVCGQSDERRLPCRIGRQDRGVEEKGPSCEGGEGSERHGRTVGGGGGNATPASGKRQHLQKTPREEGRFTGLLLRAQLHSAPVVEVPPHEGAEAESKEQGGGSGIAGALPRDRDGAATGGIDTDGEKTHTSGTTADADCAAGEGDGGPRRSRRWASGATLFVELASTSSSWSHCVLVQEETGRELCTRCRRCKFRGREFRHRGELWEGVCYSRELPVYLVVTHTIVAPLNCFSFFHRLMLPQTLVGLALS